MAAHEAVDHDLSRQALALCPFDRYFASGRNAARAGYPDHTVLLGIQVDHPVSGKDSRVEPFSSEKPDLLVHREYRFDRRMAEPVVLQNSKGHRDKNPVVSAQGGVPCPDIAVLDIEIQAVLFKIVGRVRCFFAHHVHVSLQNDRRCALIACRGILENHNVVHLILHVTEALIYCEIHEKIADGPGVPGTMGYSADLLEPVKYAFRLQVFQFSHIVHPSRFFLFT